MIHRMAASNWSELVEAPPATEKKKNIKEKSENVDVIACMMHHEQALTRGLGVEGTSRDGSQWSAGHPRFALPR